MNGEQEKYNGWKSDENLEWESAWVPEQPGLPFAAMLDQFRRQHALSGEPQEYRFRRGPKPENWMVQVGYLPTGKRQGGE